jgi:hypothetical protein
VAGAFFALIEGLVLADSMGARPRLDGVPGAFLVLKLESDSCRQGRGHHGSEPPDRPLPSFAGEGALVPREGHGVRRASSTPLFDHPGPGSLLSHCHGYRTLRAARAVMGKHQAPAEDRDSRGRPQGPKPAVTADSRPRRIVIRVSLVRI